MRVMFGPSQKPEAENHDKPSSEPISVRLREASETYCDQRTRGHSLLVMFTEGLDTRKGKSTARTRTPE